MIKTIEQFFAEIKENEALQKAFQAAVENGTAEAFLKEQQVDATLEELMAFGNTKRGELSDDELDNVSGGCSSYSPSGKARSRDKVVFLYEVGQTVEIYNTPFGTTKTARIDCKFVRYSNSWYYPYYGVEYLSGGSEEISQSLVEIR